MLNSYLSLPNELYTKVLPTPVKDPKVVYFNDSLADHLNIDFDLDLFSGNKTIDSSIAFAYSGHQFGYFTELGDGRAILLGEVIGKDGKQYDIQLKGSGRTPYSRGGDGRGTLRSMLREYLISEAMFSLGVPTTRSLAVIDTGESVFREREERGGILVRVASSHLRVGTFEYACNNPRLLEKLTEYAINRHYRGTSVKNFLREVIKKQAELVALWIGVGFIHGVINTDNVAISGETIDYGPCAFINSYDPETVYSSIDTVGRYAFGRQPHVMLWNMARFAESLAPLINDKEVLREEVFLFREYYNTSFNQIMKEKLGGDLGEFEKLLNWIQRVKFDYTNFFKEVNKNRPVSEDPDFLEWWRGWNPKYEPKNHKVIPRNHIVEEVLDLAVNENNFDPFNRFLEVLKSPYSCPPNEYTESKDHLGYRTYCGT